MSQQGALRQGCESPFTSYRYATSSQGLTQLRHISELGSQMMGSNIPPNVRTQTAVGLLVAGNPFEHAQNLDLLYVHELAGYFRSLNHDHRRCLQTFPGYTFSQDTLSSRHVIAA